MMPAVRRPAAAPRGAQPRELSRVGAEEFADHDRDRVQARLAIVVCSVLGHTGQERAMRSLLTAALVISAAVIPPAAMVAARDERPTAARLQEGRLPSQLPLTVGGGEVVLEAAVGRQGTVSAIQRLRVTPPFADLLSDAVAGWQFRPATAFVDRRVAAVESSVLVVAVFRPPAFYAGPAHGAAPRDAATPSPRVPRVETVVMPPYPPMATGDGLVLVEIELSRAAEPRGYRVLSAESGFDAAALAALRQWRFSASHAPDQPDPVYVYAVMGFRAPTVSRGRGGE